MPLKNFWSLEPGEAIFADELLKRFKRKTDFYFPFKDTGIDLIGVTKNLKGVVSFQVKESRYYESEDCAWHEVNKRKFANDRRKVDFYIFIIYFPRRFMEADKEKGNGFEKYFVIVPEAYMLEKIKHKKARKKGKGFAYVFNFRLEDDNKKLFDVRESGLKDPDYSRYLNSWDLIEKKINMIARQRCINQ